MGRLTDKGEFYYHLDAGCHWRIVPQCFMGTGRRIAPGSPRQYTVMLLDGKLRAN